MLHTLTRQWAVLLIAVVGLVATRAEAGIISATASGDATVGATPDASPVYFNGTGGFYPSSAFLSSLTGTTGGTLTFTTNDIYDFDYTNPPYPPGDRLVLDVTNNTSVALASVTFLLGGGASILDQGGYLVYPGPYSSGVITTTISAGFAGTEFSTTYDFPTPLAVGDSLGFYIPIALPTIPTTFTIYVSGAAIPEPGSLTLMVLGLAGMGAFGRMKRRKAEAAGV